MDKKIESKKDLELLECGCIFQIGQDTIFVDEVDLERGCVFYYDFEYLEDGDINVDSSFRLTKTWNDLRQKIIYGCE